MEDLKCLEAHIAPSVPYMCYMHVWENTDPGSVILVHDVVCECWFAA